MDYFISGPDKEAEMAANAKIMKEIHAKYSDIFCRNRMLQWHIFITDEGSCKPYKALSRHNTYSL